MSYRLALGAFAVALVFVMMLGACSSNSDGLSSDTAIGQTNGGIQGSTAGLILYESLRAGSNGEILAVNADGATNPIRLTASGYHDTTPAWSPDGTRIIFAATSGDRADLWWANIDNTPVIGPEGDTVYFYQVTNDQGFCLSPDWSVNNVIAFQSDRDSGQLDIYTIAPDGTLLTRITDDPGSDNNPSWSPDGAEIAFSSNRGGSPEVYVMEADGRNVRKITTTASGFASLAPSWSPDGTRFAYVIQEEASGDRDIWLMDTNGGNQVQLTNDGLGNHFPCWSPDGSQLAFERTGSENTNDIWVMDADGTDGRALAPVRERDAYPAWSPQL
jgi:TolB protein